jgi:outer membrane protein assembly factor BamB
MITGLANMVARVCLKQPKLGLGRGHKILTLATACVGLCNLSAADIPANTAILWQHVTVPGGRYGLPVCPAIGSDGSVYVVADKGIVHAFSPNGREKWKYDVGEDSWADVAIDKNDTIYVACRALSALNGNGTLRWKTPVAREPISSVAIGDNGAIYFVRDRKLCAADSDGKIKWERTTSGHFSFAPVIGSDGTIYVDGHEQGTMNGQIRAFMPDGTLKWTSSVNKSIYELAPALGGNVLYFGSSAGNLYALNSQGVLEWTFKTDRPISSTPAIGEDQTIYFACLDGSFYAVKSNGELKWKFSTGGTVVSSPAIDRDGNVYFSSRDSKLYCLDSNGSPVRTLRFELPRAGSPIIGRDGTIYLSDVDCFYAIRGSIPPSTAPWPMKRHDAQGTGRLSNPPMLGMDPR